MASDLYREVCINRDILETVSRNSYQNFRHTLRVHNLSGPSCRGSEWGSLCEWIHAVEDNLLTQQHRPWDFWHFLTTGSLTSRAPRLLNLMKTGTYFPFPVTSVANSLNKALFFGMRKFVLLSLHISHSFYRSLTIVQPSVPIPSLLGYILALPDVYFLTLAGRTPFVDVSCLVKVDGLSTGSCQDIEIGGPGTKMVIIVCDHKCSSMPWYSVYLSSPLMDIKISSKLKLRSKGSFRPFGAKIPLRCNPSPHVMSPLHHPLPFYLVSIDISAPFCNFCLNLVWTW